VSLEAHLFLALLEGTVGAMVLALTALGLSLVFGVMRIVNVAHGEFFMLGAVVTWYVSTATGSFLLALLAAPVAVAAVAILADRLVLGRIGYEPESTIVATIGLLYILQQLVLSTYGPYARPVTPPVYFRVTFPWFGYSGYKLVVAAGALIVPAQQAHYLMGQDALLLSFVVVILGGLGSLRGTLVAALVVGLSDGVISVLFSPTLAKIVATLLVAVVLALRGRGLFGEAAA
jgi:branched-chain amino acid transport system permease protein